MRIVRFGGGGSNGRHRARRKTHNLTDAIAKVTHMDSRERDWRFRQGVLRAFLDLARLHQAQMRLMLSLVEAMPADSKTPVLVDLLSNLSQRDDDYLEQLRELSDIHNEAKHGG